MKWLAVLALVLSLTGCGARDGSDAAADEAASPAEPTSEPAAGTPDQTDTAVGFIDPADTRRLNEASESVRRVTETANSRKEYDV
jgi:predicted small lipoprotein YifL